MNTGSIEQWMVSKVASTLSIPNQEVDRTIPFVCLGLDSLTFLTLTGDLAEWLGHDLPVHLLWEFPTIEALAGHLAVSSAGADEAPISAAPRDQPLPLSFSQERICRHANRQGDDNIILEKWVVKGALDYEILERSVSEVVRRHEILRTTYALEGEQFVQIIHPPAQVPLQVIDLSDEEEPAEQALEMLRKEDAYRFNLEQGPLFHVTVLRLSPLEHRIVFNLHHIVFDAAAARIFNEELSAVYAAYWNGEPSCPLPEMPVQVADFAIWQRRRLRKEGEHYQKLTAWWKEYWSAPVMARAPQLPFRWANKQEASNLKESKMIQEISPISFEKIKRLSRTDGLSYFTIFFAAFEVLLYQLTGEEEAVVGAYVSDRNRTEAKNLMGFFINLLALRTDMRGQPALREVLARVDQMIQQVTMYQEFPFDALVEEFGRDSRNVPDVQLIFQFLSDAELSFRLPDLEIRPWRVGALSRMPPSMTMSVIHRQNDTACVKIIFDAGIYDPGGVAWMMRQYIEVLETMLINPDARPAPFILADRVHQLEERLRCQALQSASRLQQLEERLHLETSQSADELHLLQRQVESLNLTLAEARRVSHSMRQSLSWRLTWPLRVVRDAAARTFSVCTPG
jgi:acyl carrier protein